MKYYQFDNSASNSFLIGYNQLENENVYNSGFAFDHFADIEEMKASLKAYEGIRQLEFPPYLYWASGRPERAFFCVVIPELQTILSHFSMPPHKWYILKVIADKRFASNQISKIYSMLQVLREEQKEIDYEKSLFGTSSHWRRMDDLITLESGEITFENYTQRLDYEYAQKRFLVPLSICIKHNYDILWGGDNILFNENVKKAIELAGFAPHNGLGFKEFTDYQIIMPEE